MCGISKIGAELKRYPDNSSKVNESYNAILIKVNISINPNHVGERYLSELGGGGQVEPTIC